MTPTKPAPMTADEVRQMLREAAGAADRNTKTWDAWCDTQDAKLADALNKWRVPEGFVLAEQAELDRLRAERDGLREQLLDLAEKCEPILTAAGYGYTNTMEQCVAFREAVAKARGRDGQG